MHDVFDTRPTRPIPPAAPDTRPVQVQGSAVPWPWLVTIALTGLTGVFTLLALWVVSQLPPPTPAPPPTPPAPLIEDRVVILTVDGATSVFRTVIENPADILRAAGLRFGADDLITVNGLPLLADQLERYPLPANRITLRRGVSITITDGSTTQTRVTTAETVAEALTEAGLALFLGDRVTPQAETPLRAGLSITIDRAAPITLIADGVTVETRTQAEDVAALLTEQGVTLNALDYTLPPENARLSDGMTVRVVRVYEELLSEALEVPYQTLYEADPERELDTRVVTVAGQNGRDERRIRIRYEDGIEVSRRDEGVVRVQEPVNQVVRYGTRVVLRTIETPDGPREYWRVLRMYATSYHPAALGGDNITATGKVLTKGIVAVNPRIVSYGTRVYVEGYGEGEAADTGGPRSTPYWIDLGYDDENYRGWSRWVQVYLLTPVPNNVNPLLP
jgi:uncharacterized protein YabE (DUF348 family)